MHRLSPGTQVATWRVESWHAQGAYGAIYRAVRVGHEHLGPVALKVSLYPWDARFAREAEVLSRLSLPGLPRLLDRGILRSGSDEHPYFVMEWVEGTPLYAWAEQHSPSPREMCQMLAGLARTLEALHASGVVHRDVKGDNVLVRLSDSFPVLIDFGSAHFEGAKRLTWQSLPPFTPEYLSVQAYHILIGQYPPALDALEDEEGAWHVISPDLRSPLAGNPRLGPRLRELLLRLLSECVQNQGELFKGKCYAPALAPRKQPQPTSSPPEAR